MGRSVQCCTCSKWIHLKCSLISFSRFRTLGSSHSWSFPPCCVPASSGDPTPTITVPSSADSSSFYTFTAQSGPFGTLSANAALQPHPRLQTSYPFSAHFISSPSEPSPPPHATGCFSTPFTSPFPLTVSGFFNGMLEVFKPRALSFSKLSTSSLSSLDPYSDYVGVNISLNNAARSHSLMFMLLLFALLRRISEPTPFLAPSFSPPEIFSFWLISIAITPSGTQKILPTPWERSI